MSETNNKLEIKNLSKRFGEKILFENLSLTVDGPAVLWAPSGWGKTTLLRILMGLEAPTSGSVEGVGRVGAVFQEDRLCPQLTAEENVALVLTAEQYKVKTQYKEQIRDDLIQLGLDDEALALPARKLSGGQKRRTQHMMHHGELYRFNSLGLLLCWMHIRWQRRRHYFCSQFVSEVLQKSGALELPKPSTLMHPSDYAELPELRCLYRGTLAGLPQRQSMELGEVESVMGLYLNVLLGAVKGRVRRLF